MAIIGVTCLRNEGPYIVDWLAHHRALGFDHFVIYTHDCDDGSDTLLDALVGTGFVTHERFEFGGERTVQWQALKLASKHKTVRKADWVLFFDCDEYLNLPAPMETVTDLIGACAGDADAIGIPWRLFGADGAVEYLDQPVTERFTKAAPVVIHYPLANLFKTLFRPEVFRQLGVHRPRKKADAAPVWYLSNGQRMLPPMAQNEKAISMYGQVQMDRLPMARLQHYSVRSAHEFVMKSKRGLPNHMDRAIDYGYWAERNFNVVEDTSIGRFADRVATTKAALMAHAGVADLHGAAVAHHQRRIKELMDDIENVRMVWRLGLLQGSAPPTAQAAKSYIAAQVKAMKYNG